MVELKDYVMNASILISLIYLSSFIHKHWFVHSSKVIKYILFCLLCIFAGWISMFYGIHMVTNSVIFDLRFVPIIITLFLLPNPIIVLIIAVGIGLSRLSYGLSAAAIVGLINVIVMGLAGIFLSRIIHKLSFLKKTTLIVIIINILNVVIISYLGVIPTSTYLASILPVALPLNILFSFLLVLIIKDLQSEFKYRMELQEKANKDPLTKLYNRRGFKRYYNQLILSEKNNIEQESITLAFIDIDKFKRINDQHGHLIGDLVLQEISRIIITHLRSSDIVTRYGGDEIVAILPNCSKTGAIQAFEKIRKLFEETPLEINERQIPITLSIGIATSPSISMRDLLEVADDAVYQAKREGRNRVICIDRYKKDSD